MRQARAVQDGLTLPVVADGTRMINSYAKPLGDLADTVTRTEPSGETSPIDSHATRSVNSW